MNILTTQNSRLTPLSTDYPSCDEYYASLLIYTGDIHPDTISIQLGLVPTQLNVRGEVILTQLGKSRRAKNSYWQLSTKESVKSKDIRDHLDWLLALLVAKSEALAVLQKSENITMGIDCVWRSLNGHGGPTLWPEQMRIMAELGLECAFDIYFFGGEKD